jgi:hypothetical protein
MILVDCHAILNDYGAVHLAKNDVDFSCLGLIDPMTRLLLRHDVMSCCIFRQIAVWLKLDCCWVCHASLADCSCGFLFLEATLVSSLNRIPSNSSPGTVLGASPFQPADPSPTTCPFTPQKQISYLEPTLADSTHFNPPPPQARPHSHPSTSPPA